MCPGRCPPTSWPRAGPPRYRTGLGPVTAADPVAALELATRRAGGPIVVAGSLYLVGAVRAVLVDDPDLRDPSPVDPLEAR